MGQNSRRTGYVSACKRCTIRVLKSILAIAVGIVQPSVRLLSRGLPLQSQTGYP